MTNPKPQEGGMNKTVIMHGETIHPASESRDCLDCLDAEIEFLKAVRKAGGITKFMEKLKNEN